MKSAKPPKPPDPNETAAATGAWNSFTAQQQQSMNMVGQNTPWGSLDYTQTGTRTIVDPNGKSIQIPSYTANVRLTPAQQSVFDKTQATESNLAQIAMDQSAWLGDYLEKPFSFDNQDAANWAYDLGAQRLDPRFAQQEDALRARLVNSGIRPGTAAYDKEMARLGQDKNDAYNQLMLQGRGQAFSEALAGRNQPLNEIIGLMSGSQVQNPTSTFAASPQSQVANVDYAGLVGQQYQGQMANWNAKVGQQQAMMGGLFGLGSSLIGAFSDRRLKKNILRVGRLDNGLPVYLYQMEDGGPYQLGLMADEVAEVNPEATIMDESGFLKVRYDLAVEVR